MKVSGVVRMGAGRGKCSHNLCVGSPLRICSESEKELGNPHYEDGAIVCATVLSPHFLACSFRKFLLKLSELAVKHYKKRVGGKL